MDSTYLVVLIPLAIEMFFVLGLFIYYWVLGFRKKAFKKSFRKITSMIFTVLIVYLLINGIYEKYNYCSRYVCLAQNKILVKQIEKIENRTVSLYNALIKSSCSIVTLDIIFSLTAIFASPSISLLLLEYFPIASNSVLNVLILGIRGLGYSILIQEVFKNLIIISTYFFLPIFIIGIITIPLEQLRKIGVSFIILGFSFGYMIPFFLSEIVDTLYLPYEKYYNIALPNTEKIGYLNFSITYMSKAFFPLATLVLWRNTTYYGKNITDIYLIPYDGIHKYKIVALPEGKYKIKGVLIYWTFFPICSTSNCPPGFAFNNSSISIEERNTTKINIQSWRIYAIPCNNSRSKGCGGLVFGIYKNRKSFSYIKFLENKTILSYTTKLSPGQSIEIFTLGAKPKIKIAASDNSKVNYTLTTIKYFSKSDSLVGKKMTKEAVKGFNKWFIRNKAFFEQFTKDINFFNNVSDKIKMIKTLKSINPKITRWKLSVKIPMKIRTNPINVSIIVVPSKTCWNYTYLAYVSGWSSIESLNVSKTRLDLLKIWGFVIKSYSIMIKTFVMITALNVVAQNVGSLPFIGSFLVMFRKHIVFHFVRNDFSNVFKRYISKRIIVFSKFKSLSKMNKVVLYNIRSSIRRKLIKRIKNLSEIELRKRTLMYEIYPSLRYVDEKHLIKIDEKISSDELLRLIRKPVKDRNKLLRIYSVLNKKFKENNYKKLQKYREIDNLSTKDIDRLYEVSKKVLVDGIQKNITSFLINSSDFIKLDKIINAIEDLGDPEKMSVLFKKIYINRVLYISGISDKILFSMREKKYINNIKSILSNFPPYKVKLLIRIIGDDKLKDISENTLRESILIDSRWIRDLYIEYTYLYDVLSPVIRKELDKIFQGINIYDVDKFYPDLLYYMRIVVKCLKRIIDKEDPNYAHYLLLSSIEKKMEESLFFYPTWFQGDSTKIEYVTEYIFNKYILSSKDFVETIKRLNDRIDYGLFFEIFLDRDIRQIDSHETIFYLSNIHYIREIKRLEEELDKRIKEYEDTSFIDERNEIEHEIKKIAEKIEKILLRLIIESERENINSSYFRKKMRKLHDFIGMLSHKD